MGWHWLLIIHSLSIFLLLARDLIRILFRDGMMSGSFNGGTASVSEPNCSLQSISLSPPPSFLICCVLLSVPSLILCIFPLSQEKGTGYHKEGQGHPLPDNMWEHCGPVSEVGLADWFLKNKIKFIFNRVYDNNDLSLIFASLSGVALREHSILPLLAFLLLPGLDSRHQFLVAKHDRTVAIF